MNFQAVEAANGNKVTIKAIATRIDKTTYIQSGTPKQNCLFTDVNGQQEEVTIWQGKGQPIPQQNQGQTLTILIGCKQKGQYINYGGYWNSGAQAGAPPQAPQGGQQGPQQPAGRPNAKKDVDWDGIARGKVRCNVVCAYIQGANLMPAIPEIEQWVDYIMTGKSWSPDDLPAGAPGQGQEEPPPF